MQSLHQNANVHLYSFQVFCSLDILHRRLNNLHVFVIPLSLFVTSTHALFLRIKPFNVLLKCLV